MNRDEPPLVDLTVFRRNLSGSPKTRQRPKPPPEDAPAPKRRTEVAPKQKKQRKESLNWASANKVASDATRGALDRKLAAPNPENIDRRSHNRRRLQDFVHAASDWVWEMDEYGSLSYVSERVSEVIGRPALELRGVYLFDLGHASGNNDEEALQKLVKARRPFRNQYFDIKGADGRLRRCALSGVPVFDDTSGRFQGYRGTGTDVTARADAEQFILRDRERLEHAIEELRNKNMYLELALNDAVAATRAKNDYLAIVSHELRTPLNAIIGFTDIMEQELFGPIANDRYQGYLENITESAELLLGIISDVLDMSKIESSRLTVVEAELNIPAMVKSAWKLMSEEASAKGVQFATVLPDNLPGLRADERIVRQMLLNLLSNGIKFTPSGGSITVAAGIRPDGDYAIRVSDTGIGIDDQDFETVLKPFGQVKNAYTRSREGTGLGLPLVKSMIEMHGGKFDLQSERNVGTTFSLIFPASRVVHGI